MNTVVLLLGAGAAVCAAVGGWRRDIRVLAVGVIFLAAIVLLPTVASV